MTATFENSDASEGVQDNENASITNIDDLKDDKDTGDGKQKKDSIIKKMKRPFSSLLWKVIM